MCRLCVKEEIMADLVAVLATTHHPFFYRASTAPPESRPDFADEWVRKVLAYRETLTRANPDVLVMVGSDHFHQLFYDNMPQFLIGKAPFYDANYYNEEREFGLPRMFLKGHEELSAYLLRAGLDDGFDFALAMNCGSTTVLPAPSSRPARKRTCPSCPSTQTSSPLHCHSPGGTSSWAAPCAALSKPGPVSNASPSSGPAICPWNLAGRASSARMGLTRRSTPKLSSGSPTATLKARYGTSR